MPSVATTSKILAAAYAHPTLSLAEASEVSLADAQRVNGKAGGQKAVTYGEMTEDSWRDVLLRGVGGLSAEDVFFDLGSGRGTLTLQAALEVPGMRCVGVELSRKRHAMAAAALRRLEAVAARKGAPPFVGAAVAATTWRSRQSLYPYRHQGAY